MSTIPPCPKCTFEYCYETGTLVTCPECGHEWDPSALNSSPSVDQGNKEASVVVRDAHGVLLQDGDSVTIIKDLKVKGASVPLKVGTKVRNIRLVEGDHNIDCTIPGFGGMKLKSEFVRKA